MKRRYLVIALAAVTLALLVWSPWRSLFGYHFDFPLPPTAQLIRYHHSRGLDSGDEFEFAVTDDALRDAIIREWDLRPAVDPEDAKSFAKVTGAPWWPGAKLDGFDERYGRVDEFAPRYWSLWVDRKDGRLYAEYGNW